MNLFCLNGYNGEKLVLNSMKLLDFLITQALKVAMILFVH